MNSSDHSRTELGFLTVHENLELSRSGVHVLDPASTLVSRGVALGSGVRLYPGVVIESDAKSQITIGDGCLLYPGTILIAAQGGSITVGSGCTFGPGGAQVKATTTDDAIRIGNDVRLANGCEVVGTSTFGDGEGLLGQDGAVPASRRS